MSKCSLCHTPPELRGMFLQSTKVGCRAKQCQHALSHAEPASPESFLHRNARVDLQLTPSLQLLGSTQPSFIFAGKAAFAFLPVLAFLILARPCLPPTRARRSACHPHQYEHHGQRTAQSAPPLPNPYIRRPRHWCEHGSSSACWRFEDASLPRGLWGQGGCEPQLMPTHSVARCRGTSPWPVSGINTA